LFTSILWLSQRSCFFKIRPNAIVGFERVRRYMIGSAKVLTISTQKWTFWVNSLTYLCCAERGQIFSDCLQNLNLGRGDFPQQPKKIFFQKSFFFISKNIFHWVHIFFFKKSNLCSGDWCQQWERGSNNGERVDFWVENHVLERRTAQTGPLVLILCQCTLLASSPSTEKPTSNRPRELCYRSTENSRARSSAPSPRAAPAHRSAHCIASV